MFELRKMALAFGCAMAAGFMAQAAVAADSGTLTFAGEVTDNTCDVVVNGGTADATITLPRVSSKTLAKAGDVTGRVFVRMNLSNCGLVAGGAATATQVHAFWQASPLINAGGRLINTDTTTGGAKNVEIQMLNNSLLPIDMSQPDGLQKSTVAAITGAAGAGTAELAHYAQYYATGASTPGLVKSKLEYVLSYN
ncbi:type 1 fimbrial protein [Pseudomonas sp. ITA]|uniref:fimbrial protein n=1 Tax=Pseudomonas sp. ITA TaxID=2825841 RepID=UPI0024989003|nr:fimbrial protein [Pseudomonas sp. ITA]MDI2145856.1 type 1 fimbrial protein [Pseudomonas sp. ITA]